MMAIAGMSPAHRTQGREIMKRLLIASLLFVGSTSVAHAQYGYGYGYGFGYSPVYPPVVPYGYNYVSSPYFGGTFASGPGFSYASAPFLGGTFSSYSPYAAQSVWAYRQQYYGQPAVMPFSVQPTPVQHYRPYIHR
jgi:hypothetical protein